MNLPIGRRTTLEIGGPAETFVTVRTGAELAAVARDAGPRIRVLGGGSNLVVHEDGVAGTVVAWSDDAPEPIIEDGGRVEVAAGWEWDDLVERTVDRGLEGIEALSGIPGRVGAAPIQNIGAYGQELGQILEAVELFDPRARQLWTASAATLGLGYRTSRLKADPSCRWIVTRVWLRLRPNTVPSVRYRDLREAIADGLSDRPGEALWQVRRAVLTVRGRKSMVWRADDENRRSCGSFFVNPVVSVERAARVQAAAAANGLTPGPAHPVDGGVKLSAAWLIEASGFRKGHVDGRVGLSTRHVLALVNRGGATATEVLRFAADIRTTVRDRWNVDLRMEPQVWGFEPDDPLLAAAGATTAG